MTSLTAHRRYSAALALLLTTLIASPGIGQVRQLRVIPDASFDASGLELSEPPALTIDGHNRVYVAERGSPQLVRLSVDGRQAEVVVREGAGPGEARGISSLGWKGDTLWLYDNRQARYSLLNAEGRFLRTMPYNERCTSTLPWHLMAGDGCLEGIFTRHPYAMATEPTPPTPVVLTSHHKQRIDTLELLSQEHGVMQFDGNNRKSFFPQPFGDQVLIFSDGAGTGVLEVSRRAARSPRRDSVLIRRWTPGLGWERHVSIHYLPRRLSDEVIDSSIKALTQRTRSLSGWVTFDSLSKKVYRPQYYPPAPLSMATSDGGLWLQLIQANDAPGITSWVVLDTLLRETARIVAPANLRVLEAKGEFCWGYILDEDDVPQIVRYRIVRGE